jgi:hypothetical protein
MYEKVDGKSPLVKHKNGITYHILVGVSYVGERRYTMVVFCMHGYNFINQASYANPTRDLKLGW